MKHDSTNFTRIFIAYLHAQQVHGIEIFSHEVRPNNFTTQSKPQTAAQGFGFWYIYIYLILGTFERKHVSSTTVFTDLLTNWNLNIFGIIILANGIINEAILQGEILLDFQFDT